jgi:YbbR domain-containing protein
VLVSYLKKDLGIKIFSLILAIILWAHVKYTSSPQSVLASEARFNVALALESVGEKYVVLDAPSEVTLHVEGAPQVLSQIKPGNFKAYINLDEKKAGHYNVPVKVIVPPDVKVTKIEPQDIQVKLDPIVKQLFTVKIKPQGSVAPGFILGQLTSQPESVTVSGAQSLISKVKEVRATCDIDKADMDIIQRVSLDIVDENEKTLQNLKAEPATIRTSIKVRPEVKNATIPINAVIIGQPEKGFTVSKITITPSSALVRYRYTLESPPVSIKTQEISIEGANGSIKKEIGLVTPSDVSLVEPNAVKLQITLKEQKPESGERKLESVKRKVKR